MKRKLLPIVAVIFLSALLQTAFGQQGPGTGPDPGKTFAPANFEETKARILRMLDERRTRLDQEKACVDAAKNMDELNKCRPEPRMRRGGQQDPGPREPMPGPGPRQ